MRPRQPVSRRGAVRVLLATTALVARPCHLARPDGVYDGPFVDAHAHLRWDAGASITELIGLTTGHVCRARSASACHGRSAPTPATATPAGRCPSWPRGTPTRCTVTRPTRTLMGWSSCIGPWPMRAISAATFPA